MDVNTRFLTKLWLGSVSERVLKHVTIKKKKLQRVSTSTRSERKVKLIYQMGRLKSEGFLCGHPDTPTPPPPPHTIKTLKAANQLKETESPNYTLGPGISRLSLLQSSNLIFCSTSLIN